MFFQLVFQEIELKTALLKVGIISLSCLSQRERTAGAREEAAAKLCLQLADLLADGGLADRKSLSGFRKAAVFNNGEKLLYFQTVHKVLRVNFTDSDRFHIASDHFFGSSHGSLDHLRLAAAFSAQSLVEGL